MVEATFFRAVLVGASAACALFLALAFAGTGAGFEAVLARASRRSRRLAAETRGGLVTLLESAYAWGRKVLPVDALWNLEPFKAMVNVGQTAFTPEALCAARALLLAVCATAAASAFLAGSTTLVLPSLAACGIFLAGPGVFFRGGADRLRARMGREAVTLAEFTAIGVAAGFSPWEALREASRAGDGPLFREVRQAVAEGEMQARLKPRASVLAGLAQRLDVPEFTAFAEMLGQAIEYGAEGFVDAIQDTVRHLRELRRAKLESVAQKAEGKMLLPLLLLLAAVMSILMGPIFSQLSVML